MNETAAVASHSHRYSAERIYELAESYFAENNIALAVRHFEEAFRSGIDTPEATSRRWLCYMLLGDFERAWQETDRSEALRKARGETTRDLPLHFQRVWNGSPLIGKRVLARCYHGFGDTIQFIRYLPLLKRCTQKVLLQVQAPLIPLVKSLACADQVFPLESLVDEGSFDADIELMELPYAFRTTVDTIPRTVPYIQIPAAIEKTQRTLLGARAGGDLRVGIVWASGNWNRARDVPLNEFEVLNTIPGLRLFSLQRGPARSQLDSMRERFQIAPLEHESETVLDTAAIIMNLDLVISVDTMVAHLAGALGKRTWTLLPVVADWRWMIEREDTPWYPTMRLFRQSRDGDWTSILERVREELLKLTLGRVQMR